MVELVKNNIGLQVLTDSGWSEFDGVLNKGIRETLILEISDYKVACTPDHKIYVTEELAVPASELVAGDKVMTKAGICSITKISKGVEETVYDLLNVEKNRRFYADGVLVSNCEFIIWDETLISPGHLIEMAPTEPLLKQGQVRWWKKPDPRYTYLVALDPSLGTGGDPAAIQIFELPSFQQVGEWQHNKTPVQRQVGILSEITKYIAETVPVNSIYYSMENNSIGEAALISVEEIGEENIKGTFLSEPKRLGNSKRYRRGFNTNHSNKIASCAKLKNLIESKRMALYSKNLISELKTFIAHGTTYAAKTGETDDLVMSLVLVVRMAQLLQSFDSTLDGALRDTLEDVIDPMPFIMM